MRYLLLLGLGTQLCAIDFTREVWPALEKGGCAGCHNDNGVASATRLRMPEGKPTAEALDAFSKSLHLLVNRDEPEKSFLVTKPTRKVGHAGGKRLDPGSTEETALIAWARHLASLSPSELKVAYTADHKAEGAVLRRLTHAQYNNTIRDLLGDDSRLADQFPPEDFVNGFRNQYLSQSISPLLAESYSASAEKLAQKTFGRGDVRALLPCKPTSAADAACRDKFLREFGRRVFRRPLEPAEVARYTKLFVSEAAAKKDFFGGAQVVTEVMLQSPNFLTRVEGGSDPKLRPYEVASKLSYFIWNSMPDDALLNAAAKGELNTATGVDAWTRKMLQSPKARASVDEFVAEWLRLDRLNGTIRERRQYPQFSAELTVAMAEETRRLVNDLVWNNGDFMQFFSSTSTFVNSDLARLYRLPEPKSEYAKLSLPDASKRAGVLGHASFLTMTSKPGETSPTARGLFVREQFLCQEVPQPPPGVNANLPPIVKEKPQTQRDRLGVHLSNESCASCHTLIDPIGFGLEQFDAIGGYREKLKLTIAPGRGEREEKPVTVELPLDTSGDVAGLRDSAFTSPRELGTILAKTPQCQRCVVKQLFRYMSGRHEKSGDTPVLDAAFEDFKASGFRFQELLVSLARRSEFRTAK